jgi:GxxExxY protein
MLPFCAFFVSNLFQLDQSLSHSTRATICARLHDKDAGDSFQGEYARTMQVELLEAERVQSILSAFFTVHNYYGYGLSESVYAGALECELIAREHGVVRELAVPVEYRGRQVAWQRLDMVVDEAVIVEIKATEKLSPSGSCCTSGRVRSSTGSWITQSGDAGIAEESLGESCPDPRSRSRGVFRGGVGLAEPTEAECAEGSWRAPGRVGTESDTKITETAQANLSDSSSFNEPGRTSLARRSGAFACCLERLFPSSCLHGSWPDTSVAPPG